MSNPGNKAPRQTLTHHRVIETIDTADTFKQRKQARRSRAFDLALRSKVEVQPYTFVSKTLAHFV
jgi:hypothetical protein